MRIVLGLREKSGKLRSNTLFNYLGRKFVKRCYSWAEKLSGSLPGAQGKRDIVH